MPRDLSAEQVYVELDSTQHFWKALLAALGKLIRLATDADFPLPLNVDQRREVNTAVTLWRNHTRNKWEYSEMGERIRWLKEVAVETVQLALVVGEHEEPKEDFGHNFDTTTDHILKLYEKRGHSVEAVSKEFRGWRRWRQRELMRVAAAVWALDLGGILPEVHDLDYLARVFGALPPFPQTAHWLSHLSPRKQLIYSRTSARWAGM